MGQPHKLFLVALILTTLSVPVSAADDIKVSFTLAFIPFTQHAAVPIFRT